MPWKFDLPFRDPDDDERKTRGLMRDVQKRCAVCQCLLLGDEPISVTTCTRHRKLEKLRALVQDGDLTDWQNTHHVAAMDMPRRAGSPDVQTQLTQILAESEHFGGKL